MRFIHTSDWHLGKSLKGESLIDDQNYIIGEIIRVANDQHADAIIIAGDIYDRAVPPTDAVELFNETLVKLVENNLKILCVAGNHDSAKRLNFGSQLFERANFFMRAIVHPADNPVILSDNHGEIYFSLLPYFEPSQIRAAFNINDSLTFDGAGQIFIANARSKIPRGARSIAVSHAFITGGERSDSETQSVGGADNVNAAHFDGYNYVALGHLHKPQCMTAAHIRYSGSPLKYSFDEWQHHKGILSVEIGAKGETYVDFLPLTPRRDLIVIEDVMSNVMKRSPTTDYVAVRLLDKTPVLNARAKLEELFPNLLSIEKVGLLRETTANADIRRLESTSMLEQFRDFFEYQTGAAMTAEELAALTECLTELNEGAER